MESFKSFIAEKTKTASPRIRRIRLRIRNGKVQRNVRKSAVKGFRLKGGRLVRMSTTERLHRRRGARRAKAKRRAKMSRTLMKRRRSLRRRHAFGL